MSSRAARLTGLASACRSIADEVADANHFVSVRALLRRFNAQIVVRPLLVEAMLAERIGAADNEPRWVLLLDSERYELSREQLDQEATARPLTARLRNSVAHELAHALAFRPAEFGVVLETHKGVSLKDIEEETERVSPLLLVPDSAFDGLMLSGETALAQLDRLRRSLGVSRQVFVRRVQLLRHTGSPGIRPGEPFHDMALLTGSVRDDGAAVASSWPLFANFDRNVEPGFLHELRRQRSIPLGSILRQASSSNVTSSAILTVPAGTEMHPTSEKMAVRIEVERDRNKGTFLVMVRRISSR